MKFQISIYFSAICIQQRKKMQTRGNCIEGFKKYYFHKNNVILKVAKK